MRADSWTIDDLDMLVKLYTAGHTYQHIGDVIGRSCEAVRHQVKKGGFPKRKKEVKKATPPSPIPHLRPGPLMPLDDSFDALDVWLSAMAAVAGRASKNATPVTP